MDGNPDRPSHLLLAFLEYIVVGHARMSEVKYLYVTVQRLATIDKAGT